MIEDDAWGGLTPGEEEQTIRILQGKCPHNAGWIFVGHSSNDDVYAFECRLCSEIDYW